MQPRSKTLLATAGLLAAVLAAYFLATAPLPPDREQILTQFENLRAALASRNAPRVMNEISASYKDTNGFNVDQIHLMILRGIKNSGPITVTSTDPVVTITGQTAASTSHIVIRSRSGGDEIWEGDITLNWQNEPTHRYVVFPSTVWRVVGAEMPGMPPLME